MPEIRHYDFAVMHHTEAVRTLEDLIRHGGGEAEFQPLRIDNPRDHLDHLCSLYMSIWGNYRDEPAHNYTWRMTYRDVRVHSDVFVLPRRKEFGDPQTYHAKFKQQFGLIERDIEKFTACHVYDGQLQARFAFMEVT